MNFKKKRRDSRCDENGVSTVRGWWSRVPYSSEINRDRDKRETRQGEGIAGSVYACAFSFRGGDGDRAAWALSALLLKTLLSPREIAVKGAIQPTRDLTPIKKELRPSSLSMRIAQSPSPL